MTRVPMCQGPLKLLAIKLAAVSFLFVVDVVVFFFFFFFPNHVYFV